jgi:hypothetical protein
LIDTQTEKFYLGKCEGDNTREYKGNNKKNNMLWLKKKQPPFGWLQNEDSYICIEGVIPLLLVLFLVRERL